MVFFSWWLVLLERIETAHRESAAYWIGKWRWRAVRAVRSLLLSIVQCHKP
jgi:hypothetical protein